MTKLLARLTIRESATIRQAMEAIDRGAVEITLVVDEGGHLLGTVTDGDIRRALLRGAAMENSVADCISRHYVAVSVRTGRAEVLDIMRARTLQQIPVLDDTGRLVGLHLLRELIGAAPRANSAVVMAGGRGERLRPITDSVPKPMIRVAGRPILERIVLHLVGHGIHRIFLSVNYKAGIIEQHFGDGTSFGCRIEYLKETVPLGTGGSLSLMPTPEHPVIVLNGDLLTQVDIAAMCDFHAAGGYMATVGAHNYVHTVPFGVLECNGDEITGIREKPVHSWLANAGVYVLQPELVARVPKETMFGLPGLIEECFVRSEPVGAFHIEDEWADIGRPQELSRARGEGEAT
ncbi:MAG: nucleotidyltransferase family protein [Thermoanaerobaculia bacterium]